MKTYDYTKPEHLVHFVGILKFSMRIEKEIKSTRIPTVDYPNTTSVYGLSEGELLSI